MRKEVGFMIFGTGVFLNIRKGIVIALQSALSLAGMSWFFAWLLDTPITGRLVGLAALSGFIGGPASILIHELAHAKMAWRFEVPTQILIRPNSVVTDFLFREQVFHPMGRLVVALAGIVVTGCMAVGAATVALLADSRSIEAIAWASASLLAFLSVGCWRGRDGKVCRKNFKKLRQGQA